MLNSIVNVNTKPADRPKATLVMAQTDPWKHNGEILLDGGKGEPVERLEKPLQHLMQLCAVSACTECAAPGEESPREALVAVDQSKNCETSQHLMKLSAVSTGTRSAAQGEDSP